MKKMIGMFLIAGFMMTDVGSLIEYQKSIDTQSERYISDEKVWAYDETGKYDYPIYQGTDEWKNFSTHKEMVEACQIPDKLLNDLSTQELFDLVEKYPLLIDVYLFDTYTEGFNIMQSRFNGIQELLGRKDVVSVLIDKYATTNMAVSKNKDAFKETQRIQLMEAILTNKSIVEKMTETEKNQVSQLAYDKYIEKSSSDMYLGEQEFIYKMAIENDTIQVVGRLKDNKEISKAGKIYVYTPKGSPVEVSKRDNFTSEIAYNLTQSVAQTYPNAKVISMADRRYNCHSYAWYNTGYTNIYWMNEPNAYVTDGSYRAIGNSHPIKGLRYILYGTNWDGTINIMHSGFVYECISEDVIVMSKWTEGPLMRHKIDYSPYDYGNLMYYLKSY